MTFIEFERKWSRYSGKESAAHQEHFNDLCRLLDQPTPAEADPPDPAGADQPGEDRWGDDLKDI